MSFVVVEFEDQESEGIGHSVAAVHNQWLTPKKKEVFWPPYKEQSRFDKALRTGEDADSSKWSLHKIARVFYATDDLLKAKRKLKDSQLTSNLESEDESQVGRGKRKKILCKRISSSDDEVEPICSRPPLINKPCSTRGLEAERHRIDSDYIQSQYNSSQNFGIPSTCTPKSNVNCEIKSTLTPQRSIQGQYNLDKLVSLVATIKEQNDQILQWIVTQQKHNNIEGVCLPDIPFTFPLQSILEVEELHNYLNENNDIFHLLASYLGTLGGNHISGRTNRILKYLVSDPLAAKYNFYGKRSTKRPFFRLSLKNLVVCAVKLCTTKCTEKEVEDAIKVWLKHASDRVRKPKLDNNGRENQI